jgi:hypothetical protein
MQLTRSRSSLWILVISLTVSLQAQSGPPESSSKIVETNPTFPSPVQWATDSAEISLMHVAWGPANSPEILSKGRHKMVREQAIFYPDHPYVLALGFSAKSVGVVPTTSYSTSGLVRVKDTDGDIEVPMALTPEGFVPFSGCPGVYDVHFDKNTTTEYWDLLPAASDQKEFLFRVFPGDVRANNPRLSFRIVLRRDDIAVVNVSPQLGTSCIELRNDIAGTVGASAHVKVHLVGKNATVSGTEQYQRIGKTLWLRGSIDSLGNVVAESPWVFHSFHLFQPSHLGVTVLADLFHPVVVFPEAFAERFDFIQQWLESAPCAAQSGQYCSVSVSYPA